MRALAATNRPRPRPGTARRPPDGNAASRYRDQGAAAGEWQSAGNSPGDQRTLGYLPLYTSVIWRDDHCRGAGFTSARSRVGR
jgi:hypothetical protein